MADKLVYIPSDEKMNLSKARKSVRKNELCDVIKGRDERRSGKGNLFKRDGSVGVTQLIFWTLCRTSIYPFEA